MTAAPDMIATYRLQLTPAFGFAGAKDVVPHVAALGASHLYLSPIFEACPGSTHGYDQTDPTRLRAELGGESAFVSLARAAAEHGLGMLIDIVPNHMAAHHANPWWFGLLKHGPGSAFDRYFDVQWEEAAASERISSARSTKKRVILPVLGAPLDDCVTAGQIELRDDPEIGRCIAYFDKRFPLRQDSDLTPDMSPGSMLRLLAEQHYELAFWRDGLERINYRRFFDIAELAGLRIEDPAVFDASHAKLLDLARRSLVHGVRVDHIDGLRDPLAYLTRLGDSLARAAGRRIPIFVEKILGTDETLPDEWPVAGTTGYAFLAAMGQIASDQEGVRAMRRHASLHDGQAFRDLVSACKREVAGSALAPELRRLCAGVERLLDDASLAIPPESIRSSIVEISANLDVYRTYGDARGMSSADVARIQRAAGRCSPRHRPDARVVELLTLAGPFETEPLRSRAVDIVQRWQQLTGPLAAKGGEDTALYRDTATPWLCDVGAEPELHEPASIVRRLRDQRRVRPLSLNTTDTHDAKRSEDLRAALATLSTRADEWNALIEALLERTSSVGLETIHARLLAHSLFALLGTGLKALDLGPRLKAFLVKAARESKVGTSWLDSNTRYEHACERSVDLLLGPSCDDLLAVLAALRERLSTRAARISVAQVFLKVLFPGVPDFYQGSELPVFALVDPDNRSPVDFGRASKALELVRAAWRGRDTASLVDHVHIKLFAAWRALAIRRHLKALGTIELESSSFTPSFWNWTLSAGRSRAEVFIALDPDLSPERTASFDQFGGMLVNSGQPWATLVISGAAAAV